MRWLIVLLLLLNLVLFLWMRMFPAGPSKESLPAEIGELRLWSEVEREGGTGESLQPSSEGTASLPEEGEAAVDGDAPSSLALQPPSPEPKPQPNRLDLPQALPEPLTLPLTVDLEDEPTAEPVPDAPVESEFDDAERSPLPEPVATQVPPAGAPAMEQDPGAQPAEDSTEQNDGPMPATEVAVAAEEVPASPPLDQPFSPLERASASEPQWNCGELRWFAEESQAGEVADLLGRDGVDADVRSEDYEEQTGYWVLVPPQTDSATARAIRAELQAKGIEDLWLFTAGPMQHSISLGMFRGLTRADRRAEEIRALGFDVEVRPKLSDKTRYLVGYRADTRGAEAVSALLATRTDLENRTVVCPVP